MSLAALHLVKNRYGVWYYRWVVPRAIRERYPELPRELKRSTKTADIRQARVIARGMHHACLLKYAPGQLMSLPADLFRAFEIHLDESGRPQRLVATQDEAAVAVEAFKSVLNHYIDQASQRAAAGPVPSMASAPVPGTAPTISQAFEDFAKLQRSSGEWSDETLRYTHAPSITLFRELVGDRQPRPATDGAAEVDLSLAHLDKHRIDRFLEEFWRFPARQGRRSELTARELLERGGTPQSRANVFKRLGHVRLFIEHCVQKGWVQPQVLQAVDLVLSKDTKRNRLKAAAQKPGFDGTYIDGYVSFSSDELAALFGPAFQRHAAARADRYWIPLLGLYAGLRVGEAGQLQCGDFIAVEGVNCIEVKAHALEASQTGKTRVKTGASIRKIPVHPRLVELGLLDYVEERRRQHKVWLWDDLLWTQKDGYGKYPSRDFNRLAKAAKVYQHRRKVFHSLRSNFSQALERAGMPPGLADRIIGHQAKTVRDINYGRTDDGQSFPARLIYEKLAQMEFPVQPEPWTALGTSVRPPRSGKKSRR